MKVAVISLTRDRLDSSRHCFQALRDFAGADFDHYVVDQNSGDGTAEWLLTQPVEATLLHENIGISRAMNLALDEMLNPMDYDAIIKVDNDCELTMPDTLRDVAQLAFGGGCLLSPRILGLQNPPQVNGELRIGDEVILDVAQIGGIFLAAPAWVYDDFRFNEDNPYWGLDDVQLCSWFRGKGGTCGYVKRLEAWHYQTTGGQHASYPEYFARTLAEGKPAL